MRESRTNRSRSFVPFSPVVVVPKKPGSRRVTIDVAPSSRAKNSRRRLFVEHRGKGQRPRTSGDECAENRDEISARVERG